MPETQNNLPSNGFALVVDGEVKTEFTTREGVARAAVELKRRFPGSRIGVYDALAKQSQVMGDTFELG